MTYLAYFTPIILTVLVVILVIALRWFSYKERMALIAQGVSPDDRRKNGKNHKLILATGLIIGLVGLALTIGLFTLGMGPWLLVGLLPLFVGLAFILVSMVLAPAKEKKPKEEPQPEPVIEEPVVETFEENEDDDELEEAEEEQEVV